MTPRTPLVPQMALGAEPHSAMHDGDSADAVCYVSVNGNDNNSGHEWYTAKATVAAALNSLNALTTNGHLILGGGQFTVAAKLASTMSNLRISGQGAVTVLKAANALNDDVMSLQGTNLTVEHLVIDGNISNQTGGGVYRGLVLTNCTNVLVFAVTARNCQGHGIYLDNAGGAWSEVNISHCSATGNGNTTNLGNGIVVVAGNRGGVVDCVCQSNVGDGIYTQSLTNMVIDRNVCESNRGYGIEGNTSILRCSYSGNICTANTESGIGFDAVAVMGSNTLVGNVCDANGGAGIQIFSGSGNPIDNTVVGNVCTNNSQPGLVRVDLGVAGMSTVTLTRDGIELSGAKRTTVVGNICLDDQGTMTQRYPFSDGGGATAALIGLNDFPDNGSGGISLAGTSNIVGLNNGSGTALGGGGLQLSESANGKQGVATLVAGSKVVNNTSVTATSRIHLTVQSLGTVAAPKAVAVTARTAGTSFTITSADATDTSVVAWEIFEAA